jgi:hypothetical protein
VTRHQLLAADHPPAERSHRRGLRLVRPHAGSCRLSVPAACEPRPEPGASIRAARLSKFSEDTVAVANLCSQQSFHLVFAAALNARGVAMARSGRWQAQTDSNVRRNSAAAAQNYAARRSAMCSRAHSGAGQNEPPFPA